MLSTAASGHTELRWLATHIRPYSDLYASSLLCLVLGSVLALAEPLLVKWLIDEAIPAQNYQLIAAIAVLVLLAAAFRLTFNGIAITQNYYASQRVVFDLRRKLFRHLERLPASYYAATPSGETLYLVDQDTEAVHEVAGSILVSVLRFGIICTATVGLLLALNWRLTLIVMVLAPVVALVRRLSGPRLKTMADRVQRESAARTGLLHESIQLMQQIQLLRLEALMARRAAGASRTVLESQVARRLAELVFSLVSLLVSTVATAVVLGYGGFAVARGALTLGGLVAFVALLSRLIDPLDSLADIYARLERAQASIRRIRAFLAIPHAPGVTGGGRRVPRDPLIVCLEGVGFAYPSRSPTLTDASLELHPGRRIALVGSTGAGKTTVARLLVRLYDPQSGRITVNGYDLRSFDVRAWREATALVPQEPLLFDGTLRENIFIGRSTGSSPPLAELLASTQLIETIARLPDGLDTRIGQRGVLLSGGERQRIAIARALVGQPRLLILDEATSGLDGPTEHRLLAGMEPFLTQCITIVISHRLSTVRWAGTVVTLRQGVMETEGGAPSRGTDRPHDVYLPGEDREPLAGVAVDHMGEVLTCE